MQSRAVKLGGWMVALSMIGATGTAMARPGAPFIADAVSAAGEMHAVRVSAGEVRIVLLGQDARLADTSDRIVLLGQDARHGEIIDRIVMLGQDSRLADPSDRIVLLGQDARLADTSDRIVLLGQDARSVSAMSDSIVLLGQDARDELMSEAIVFLGQDSRSCTVVAEADEDLRAAGLMLSGAGACGGLRGFVSAGDFGAARTLDGATTRAADAIEVLLAEGLRPADFDAAAIEDAARAAASSPVEAASLALDAWDAGDCAQVSGFAAGICAALY